MTAVSSSAKPLLCWLDCEMTGLDVTKDLILEIGIKVSDVALAHIEEGPSYVIHVSSERLALMDDWCQKTHQHNGLIAASLASTCSVEMAEEGLMLWLAERPAQTRYLAGSSIWCDRMFLKQYMPGLEAMFHYRMLDVSALKIMFQHALHAPYQSPKSDVHRVMLDVDHSIREYRYYLERYEHSFASSGA